MATLRECWHVCLFVSALCGFVLHVCDVFKLNVVSDSGPLSHQAPIVTHAPGSSAKRPHNTSIAYTAHTIACPRPTAHLSERRPFQK